jgi:hypothetical protein
VQLTLGQLIIGNWQLIIYEEKTKEITTLSVDLHVVTSPFFCTVSDRFKIQICLIVKTNHFN